MEDTLPGMGGIIVSGTALGKASALWLSLLIPGNPYVILTTTLSTFRLMFAQRSELFTFTFYVLNSNREIQWKIKKTQMKEKMKIRIIL